MRTKTDLLGGILLVLVGAAAMAAALGAMASVGIHSSPAFWVLGAAGVVFGRLLLHSGFGLRGSGDALADIDTAPQAASPIFRESGGSSSQEQAETAWFASATKL